MNPAVITMAERLREIFLSSFAEAGGCEEYAARAVQWLQARISISLWAIL